ncbi:hypothetical protein LXA43DRAFT_1103138 [Ganoderma leucocontextum]|nr:hypothetical protein LXA43DRAFT_1103138 [Ganoderma leucocontextum]
MSPQMFSSAPAASSMAPICPSCQCTSTGTIVGIAIAAASAASVFTMLLILCVLQRNRRSASTNPARLLTDSFPESKNPNPSPSSIRDTVILISPDREKQPVSVGAEMRRSSESHYSQYSRHGGHPGDDRLSVSVPQLPVIILSPPLLSPSSSEFESQRWQRSDMSPPGTPAHAYTHTAENGDARQTSVRSFSSSRIPSVIGSFAGSDRTVLPRLIEVDGDALNVDVNVAAAPLAMMPAADSKDRDGRAVPARRWP